EAARAACAHGLVRLRVFIDPTGNVRNVATETSSGNADLDAAATIAVRHWTFHPGSANGQPAAGELIMPVNFADPCADGQ
ncbi:MAG TPA: energy transducer TonB, partial [Verrucomicrobiae bacterium]|nr:energy transducer TonB [Verrucomicrobiae bacterium]